MHQKDFGASVSYKSTSTQRFVVPTCTGVDIGRVETDMTGVMFLADAA